MNTRFPWQIVALALLLASPATLSAAEADEPQPITLQPDAILFGEAKDAYLWIDRMGDFNGDGISDMILDWYPRPTRAAHQAAVALGRPGWPASAGVSELSDLYSLGLPVVDGLSPNAPTYVVQDVLDANGDGFDDVVVQKDERRAGEPKAREARVYFGRPDWGAIDATSDDPDLLVRQARAPWTSSASKQFHMPDRLSAGDFNGDGRQDLAVGSCGVPGAGVAAGSTDVHIYLAPEGVRQRIDLGTTEPDAIIEAPGNATDAVTLGCGALSGNANDLNGDGMADLLFTAWLSGTAGTRSYLVFGRRSWPATAALEDVADVVMEHRGSNPGASASLVADISGDGRKDLIVDFHDPVDGAAQCVLFSGRAFRAEEDMTGCDLRATGLGISDVGDVDGDGARDLFFAQVPVGILVPPREWLIVRGPFAPGAEVAVDGSSGQGDYVIRIPERTAMEGPVLWRFEDVSGDGRDDALLGIWNADSPTGTSKAGTLALHLGPVVEGPATPVPMPSATPTSAPTASASPTLEATPDEPTATALASATRPPSATPATPTAAPATPGRQGQWTVYLPMALAEVAAVGAP